MKLHRNAKTTPTSRLELVRRDGGRRLALSGRGRGLRRERPDGGQMGPAVPAARSGRPGGRVIQAPADAAHHLASPGDVHSPVAGAARLASLGDRPRVADAAVHGRGLVATLGLSQRPMAPSVPIQRYEWPHPGDLLHVDIKPLGRFRRVGHRIHGNPRLASPGAGWEYVHVAVDDHTRLAYVEVLADQRGPTCAAFLERTVTWFGARHITSRRVMSDNGSGYVSRAFRAACAARTLRHLRTRPYTPRTNGKAERFIQTLLREWAYVQPYATSGQRRRALRPWLRYYNHDRPHASLNYQPPSSRLQSAA